MSNVFAFPRKPLSEDNAPWSLTEQRFITECRDPIHVFANRGAACQCGEQFWPKDNPAPGLSA